MINSQKKHFTFNLRKNIDKYGTRTLVTVTGSRYRRSLPSTLITTSRYGPLVTETLKIQFFHTQKLKKVVYDEAVTNGREFAS